MKQLLATLTLILFAGLSVSAHTPPSRFFANEELQRQAPLAFALQPESETFVKNLDRSTMYARLRLVFAIEQDAELVHAISIWNELTIEEQIPFLKKIFALQCRAMNITPPELVIENDIIPGSAFFEFDLTNPGPGKVILNPKELAKEKSKFASLALLIHETRHSAQFQEAFDPQNAGDIFAEGYKASFIAQKTLKGFSFCDFLTLLNEYEAFQFGNYVVGQLTDWKIEMLDMGTFASQYKNGTLRIDLATLTPKNGESLLELFNELEKEQEKILQEP